MSRIRLNVSLVAFLIIAILAVLYPSHGKTGPVPAGATDEKPLPSPPVQINPSGIERLEIEYYFLKPQTKKVDWEYHSVEMKYYTFKFAEEPGLPLLPIKTARIVIPQGRDVEGINVVPGNKVTLEGQFKIEYAKQQIPIEPPEPKKVKTKLKPIVDAEPNMEVYGSSSPFPDKLYSEVSTQYLAGYKILTLHLYPVQYIPLLGEVSYYPNMRVVVTTVPAGPPYPARARCRNLPEDISRVKRLIDNTSTVNTYTEEAAGSGETGAITEATSLPLADGPYEYVIITTDALKSTFQTLAQHKASRGLTTNIVTVEWIYANYDGTRPDGGTDSQTKIRNFIIDAYNNWSTQYVILGGDGDGDGGAVIPHRGVYGRVGATVDEDIPCDMYYGALDGDWDTDEDGVYGEITRIKGKRVDEADLLTEVYVGRIAADNATEAANQISKIIDYENSIHSRNALLIGEQLDTYPTYGGDYKDEVYTYFPADWIETQLYERDGTFSTSAVINAMNSNQHQVVNHMGHASNAYDMGLDNADVDGLVNDTYFLAYSQGCYSNAFDNRTDTVGDYTVDAISEHFTAENDNAAFAYIGNTRYGWYVQGSTDGASQQFDKEFFDAIFNEGITNVGIAFQDSKEDLVGQVGPYGDGAMRWCYFTLCLLGDPETPISWSDDTTPPAGAPSTPTDEGVYSYDKTITFDWTQGTANDPESGIAGYYLQVGTTPGGNDKFDADVGNVLTKDIEGCETGKTYYARVKARNGAGLYGGYSGSSDGITIAYPDFTLTSADITFSNDNPQPGEVITISATIHSDGGEYVATPILTDQYYDSSNGASDDAYYAIMADEFLAQSFTPSSDFTLSRVSLYIFAAGTPGTLTIKIEGDAAGLPDDTNVIATAPSIDSGPSGPTWIDFDFSDYPSLTSGTRYWIVAEGTGPDLSNCWAWATDNTSATFPYGYFAANGGPGTAWTSYANFDAWFRVYKGNLIEVQFFDGDPDSGGSLIGADYLSSIPAFGTATASVSWTATSGSHDIYVVVDPDNLITESDEANNKAYKSLPPLPTIEITAPASILDWELAPSGEQPKETTGTLKVDVTPASESWQVKATDEDGTTYGKMTEWTGSAYGATQLQTAMDIQGPDATVTLPNGEEMPIASGTGDNFNITITFNQTVLWTDTPNLTYRIIVTFTASITA